jgi:acyl-CoA synthetase (AMP-forming)/AMP-acid ligase II
MLECEFVRNNEATRFMSISANYSLLDYGGPVNEVYEPFPDSALDCSIVHRLDAIARRFSGRIAIADGARSLTYAQLADLVGRVASATIRTAGDRPGPVAILLPRCVHFPAAILGILGAKRCCVPLGTENPVERNLLIAKQSGAVAVVAAGDLADSGRETAFTTQQYMNAPIAVTNSRHECSEARQGGRRRSNDP